MSLDVTLSSSLNGSSSAYPQQVITFTCVTRGSSILAWSSDEYIGPGGALLTFVAFDPLGTTTASFINPDTAAVLVSSSNENGEIVLESTLQITVSSLFPTSSVACHNVDGGAVSSFTFHIPGEQN